MQVERLGRTDLDISKLGFGTAPLGESFGPVEEAAAIAVVHEAWTGHHFFDTAASYGSAEERLAKALVGGATKWWLAPKPAATGSTTSTFRRPGSGAMRSRACGSRPGLLDHLVLTEQGSGREETVAAGGLFLMIGAHPRTEWLPSDIDRDDQGFILTGTDLPASRAWPLNGVHSFWRPACRPFSPPATFATALASGSPPPLARVPSRSSCCTACSPPSRNIRRIPRRNGSPSWVCREITSMRIGPRCVAWHRCRAVRQRSARVPS